MGTDRGERPRQLVSLHGDPFKPFRSKKTCSYERPPSRLAHFDLRDDLNLGDRYETDLGDDQPGNYVNARGRSRSRWSRRSGSLSRPCRDGGDLRLLGENLDHGGGDGLR
jgi:hypothetical protein